MNVRLCTDCGAPPCKRGLKRDRCHNCYNRHVRALKKAGVFAPVDRTRPAVDRLLEKGVAGYGGCIIFTGYLDKAGYGKFKAGPEMGLAHRAAYELLVGPIPEGLQLDHLCHTRDGGCVGGPACLHRRCINPHHLEPVTNQENALRSPLTLIGANVRKTHCPSGHPYDEANTYHCANGNRQCRQCACDRQRAYRAAKAGGVR